MVLWCKGSTSDSESDNASSNLAKTLFFFLISSQVLFNFKNHSCSFQKHLSHLVGVYLFQYPSLVRKMRIS